MELGWVDNYEQIKSVILAPGAGETGFTALGEIPNGTVNPSGEQQTLMLRICFPHTTLTISETSHTQT
ncbi:MAG: hypothetical protein ACLVBP_03840 [Ruminococcus sp.]